MILFRIPSLLFLGLALAVNARGDSPESNSVEDAHVEVQLISEKNSVQVGKRFWIGLRLKMEKKWHTYWRNPGDSGLPTRISWDLPSGVSISPFFWPKPEKQRVAHLVNYGYSDQILLPMRLKVSKADDDEIELKAKVKWLACKEECIPGKADLFLKLPITDSEPETNSLWKPFFKNARRNLPIQLRKSDVSAVKDGNEIKLALQRLPKGFHTRSAVFFPFKDEVMDESRRESISQSGENWTITIPTAEEFNPEVRTLGGVIVLKSENREKIYRMNPRIEGLTLPKAEAPEAEEPLWMILLFALLGGLILNLMPCVFPVLAIKVLAFVKKANQRKSAVQRHALTYCLGVVLSFLVLASVLLILKSGGEQLGWGFQLQSPLFLVFLIYLFFLLALNLAGRFEVGTGMMGVGSGLKFKSPYWDSFFTGVLAVIVATPCSAPFMGAAIGFALTQSAWVTLLVFFFLGLGMAIPYVALSLNPNWLKKLPKPGPWMKTFREVLAFLLLATVIWLLWVFNIQTGPDGLVYALGGVLALYIGIWFFDSKKKKQRALGLLCFLIALGLAVTGSQRKAAPTELSSTGEIAWEKFSPERIEELRGRGRTVFVNFTAAWCLTCKVNEKAVFTSSEVQKKLKEKNIATLVGDWTNRDAQITQFLARFGRAGVPVYLLYKKGGPAEVLPQILTPGMLLEKID